MSDRMDYTMGRTTQKESTRRWYQPFGSIRHWWAHSQVHTLQCRKFLPESFLSLLIQFADFFWNLGFNHFLGLQNHCLNSLVVRDAVADEHNAVDSQHRNSAGVLEVELLEEVIGKAFLADNLVKTLGLFPRASRLKACGTPPWRAYEATFGA